MKIQASALLSVIIMITSCKEKNNAAESIIQKDSNQEIYREKFTSLKENWYPNHTYSSKKLVIFIKNELDNNEWKSAIHKDINCKVKIDEKSHIVTIIGQNGEEIERLHYMEAKAEYDQPLSAYVIRRVHDQLNKKIFALVFSSVDLADLRYIGIMKTPDENGFMPLWVYTLE